MVKPQNPISLSFNTTFGNLQITEELDRVQKVTLTLTRKDIAPKTLGVYCSINDALSAVIHQRTGAPEWDQLPPDQLPHRIHDIACWNLL